MRIAILGPTWPFTGGLTHYNVWLSNFLQRRGHTIKVFSYTLFCPKRLYPGKKLVDVTQSDRSEFEYVRLINSANPFNWPKVVRKVKSFNPNYILIYWWTPFMAPMYRYIITRVNAKAICVCHNVIPHERTPADKRLTRRCFRTIDYFIVHGQKEKDDLLNFMPKINASSIIVTPHPSYNVQFVFEELSKAQAQEKLQLSGKVLLFFGFIRPYKGLPYLLQALPLINEKYVDVTLLIVGEFWKGQREIADKIIKEHALENIRIVDEYVPDEEVGMYFQASDVVILPYESATGSGIIQIAFGFKKPVIATDVGTLAEIVHDKKSGLIIPPKNVKSIADAVSYFFEKLDQKNLEKYIEKDAYRFSWNKLVDVIEDISSKSQ
jgi:glycosyltransferase involved in cell wall biosynthesis